MTNSALEPLAKPKSKFTLLCIGAGMMGVDVRKPIVSKGWVITGSGEKLCYSEPRGRKIYNLEAVLRSGAIVLRGFETSRPIFESHARRDTSGFQTFIMDGVGGRFIDYNEEGTAALIDYLRKHLVLHTLTWDHKLTLLKEMKEKNGDARTTADPDFKMKLLQGLGPPVQLTAAVPKEPERKGLLTDVMKAELRANTGKEPHPLYKIFSPEGAATWLLYSLEEDGDTLWAVCDLGMGCVEYGIVSLQELETGRGARFKLPFERDRHFDGRGFNMREALGKTSLAA